MRRFKDNAGREWGVEINTWWVEQITQRESADIDNLLVDEGKGLSALFASSPKVIRVLWVLVEEDAAKVGITLEQFLRSFGGDSLQAAGRALYEAIADFSPPRIRELLLSPGPNGTPSASSSSATAAPESPESIPPA